MNKKHLAVLAVSALLGTMTLAACGGNSDDSTTSSEPVDTSSNVTPTTSSDATTTTYTVTFYSNGSVYYSEEVEEGKLASKPATDPTKDADEDYTYTFDGWYAAGAGSSFDFASTKVTKNLDLYAKFNSAAVQYDSIVWIWGGTTETTYITQAEADNVKATIGTLDALKGKTYLVKYFTPMSNDEFNAKVGETITNFPDVVISGANMINGDYAISLSGDGPRAKVGAGWFTNSSRYTGIVADTTHLEAAKAIYNALLDNGPDYFTLNKIDVTLQKDETFTLEATLKTEGKSVTYTSNDTSVVTVSDTGVVTAVAEEGETTITAVVGVYSVTVTVHVVKEIVDYALVVYVNGHTSIKITEEESDYMYAQVQKALGESAKISWNYVQQKDGDFASMVNSKGNADIVIGSTNLESDSCAIYSAEGYGKAALGDGWVSTSRYVLVAKSVADDDKVDAVKVYEMLQNVAPTYAVTLDRSTASVTVGQTTTLTAKYYGSSVTWSSDNEAVATVADGVVTGVSAGEATITVTDEAGHTATCVVTVSAYVDTESVNTLHVEVYTAASSTEYVTDDEYKTIVDALKTKYAGTDKKVVVNAIYGVNAAPFGDAVRAITDYKVDMVIARSNVDSEKYSNLQAGATGKTAVDVSWITAKAASGKDPTQAYAMELSTSDSPDMAKEAIDMLAAAKPSAE